MEQEVIPQKVEGRITDLKNLIVISKVEGKLLGKVADILIDPKTKKLSGIVVKDDFWHRDRFYFSIQDVETVGEDVILINTEKSFHHLSDEKEIPGLSLASLKGHGVMTDGGKDLGSFTDANFQTKSWELSEIFIDHDKCLKVDVSKITIGVDQILVPASYVLKIEKNLTNKNGLLSRILNVGKNKDHKAEKILH